MDSPPDNIDFIEHMFYCQDLFTLDLHARFVNWLGLRSYALRLRQNDFSDV